MFSHVSQLHMHVLRSQSCLYTADRARSYLEVDSVEVHKPTQLKREINENGEGGVLKLAALVSHLHESQILT